MEKNNKQNAILSEHNAVMMFRYVFAIVNFAAILAGAIITMAFMGKRGVAPALNYVMICLIVVNIIQLGLCVTDFVLKRFMGIYMKWLTIVTYSVGGLWILLWVVEMIVGSVQLGGLRYDLLVVDIIQLILGFVAYIVWPVLDKGAVDALTRIRMNDDDDPEQIRKKRKATAGHFVRTYIIVCVAIIFAQVVMLLAYKIPPRVYDLFDESRALEYKLNEDGDGYEVVGIYKGTSTVVNIPATYNDKPVVALMAGALDDENLLDRYKVQTITFGTPEKDAEGNEVIKSNLKYIRAGAIRNDNIKSLTLPSSVEYIESGAIESSSLVELKYEAQSDFSIDYLQCSALEKITMAGSAGRIVSLEGMDRNVNIEVDKDIYNRYRQDNPNYLANFTPTLDEDEICLDFYTGCGVYIESIFGKKTEGITINVDSLKSKDNSTGSLVVDTRAYLANKLETGTAGAKADSAFRGWYTDSSFVNEYDFGNGTGTYTFRATTSLYAKWIDEYSATLEWGTYTPAGRPTSDVVYWTADHDITFPNFKYDEDKAHVAGTNYRKGYKDGVRWYPEGEETGSGYIESNALRTKVGTLHAKWQLDAPINFEITHLLTTADRPVDENPEKTTYIFDENLLMKLNAVISHDLIERNGTDGLKSMSYQWYKDGQRLDGDNDSLSTNNIRNIGKNLRNVSESGVYTLELTLTANTGETVTVTAETERIVINKKDIDMTGVDVKTKITETYDGNSHYNEERYTGKPATNGVEATYRYLNSQGSALSKTDVCNAGDYTIEITFTNKGVEADNYNIAKRTITLTIEPMKLQFDKWVINGEEKTSVVYSAQAYTATMKYVTNNVPDRNITFSYTNNNKTDVESEINTTVDSVDNPNYSIDGIDKAKKSFTWSITEAEVEPGTWMINGIAGSSTVYSGEDIQLKAQVKGVIGSDRVSFIYDVTGAETRNGVSEPELKVRNAGTYTVTVCGVDNKNYKLKATEKSNEYTISKKTLSVAFANTSTNYNAEEQSATATIRGFCGTDAQSFDNDSFKYGSTDTTRTTKAEGELGACTINFIAKDAKSYTIAVEGFAEGLTQEQQAIVKNYSLTSASTNFEIQKKPLTISVESGVTYTYNAEQQDLKFKLDGVPAAEKGLTLDQFTFDPNSNADALDATNTYLIKKATDAGEYTLKVTAITNTNYTLSSQEYSIRINQATLTGKWMYSNAQLAGVAQEYSNSTSLTYNGAKYTLTLALSGVYEKDEGIVSVSSYSGNANTEVNAEVYTATAEFTYKNYQISPATLECKWSILPATLSVVWEVEKNTHTYNGQYQGPSFTVSGLVGGDGSAVKINVKAIAAAQSTKDVTLSQGNTTYSLTGENGMAVDAKTYMFNFGELSGDKSKNYKLPDSKPTTDFEIGKKTVRIEKWVYADGDQAIVNGASVIYNSKAYTVTAKLAEGSEETRVSTGKDVLTITHTDNSATKFGSYTTKANGLEGAYSENYQLANDNATLTWSINKKAVNVKWHYTEALEYSGGEQTITAYVEAGATSDDDGKAYETVSLILKENSKKDVGKYTATAELAADDTSNNYILNGGTSQQSWEIKAKPVSSVLANIKWSDSEFTYDGNTHVPTATLTVNGTEIRAQTYSGNTNDAKNVNSYSVKVTSFGENISMDEANVTHSFTIKPLVVTLAWYYDNNKPVSGNFVYDGKAHKVYASVTNKKASDSITLTYKPDSANNTFQNSGKYTFEVTALDNQNYKLSGGATTTINVTPAPVTIGWTSSTKVIYNAAAHALTPSVNKLNASDDVKAKCKYYISPSNKQEGEGPTDAGVYTFEVTELEGNSKDNYTLERGTNLKSQLTIDKQPVKIVWQLDGVDMATNTQDITLDNKSHNLTAKVTGTINTGVTITVVYTGNSSTSFTADSAVAHTATITALSGAHANNYTLDNCDGSISATINVKQVPAPSRSNTASVSSIGNVIACAVKNKNN